MLVGSDYDTIDYRKALELKELRKWPSCKCNFSWFFQILVWIMIIATITTHIIFSNTLIFYCCVIGFVVCYIIYIIIEVCNCAFWIDVCDMRSVYDIYEAIRGIISDCPSITFKYESSHIETRTETISHGDNDTYYKNYERKVITNSDSFTMPYYSIRDVSGLLYLNCNKNDVYKKHYIRFRILYDINFADAISYMDYQKYKMDFYKKERPKDDNNSYYESRCKFNQCYFAKIDNGDSCSDNVWYLFLSAIFTVSEFYKLYLDSMIIDQTFIIRKIVSTRYDLSQPIYNKKYEELNPRLDLIKEQYSFGPRVNLKEFAINNLPTEEELEKAKIYENKVPNYIISTGDKKIPNGAIIKNSNHYDYDREFIHMEKDLETNEINTIERAYTK